jgi:hypothetical protein
MPTAHHAAVHRVLATHAASCRRIAAGVDGVIGRAQYHFESAGDPHALAMLAQANVALLRLRNALATRDEAAAREQRIKLARLASDWRDNTPLILVAGLFAIEGAA